MHFAEQRAAPYSQKNSKTKRYTVDNNVGGTNNLLAAVVDSDLGSWTLHTHTHTLTHTHTHRECTHSTQCTLSLSLLSPSLPLSLSVVPLGTLGV